MNEIGLGEPLRGPLAGGRTMRREFGSIAKMDWPGSINAKD